MQLPTEKERRAGQLPIYVGNKTECALLNFLSTIGINYMSVRRAATPEKITNVITFNSVRKSMTTVYNPKPNKYLVLVKGATEVILEK